MKIAVVVLALIGSAVSMSYGGPGVDHPNTFDRLDNGYPNPEKLAVIENFGVGLAVPNRKTKFSPVQYVHGGNSHGGNIHGGNSGIITGGHSNGGVNPHQQGNVNPHGLNNVNINNINNGNTHGLNNINQIIDPHRGNQGYGNQLFSGNQGQNVNAFGNRGLKPDLRQGGFHRFGLTGKGFDGRLHRVEQPTQPNTGHEIKTDLTHIGVPLASRPVHTPLKGYPAHPPIRRLPIRNLDLGAHASNIQSTNKGDYQEQNAILGAPIGSHLLDSNIHPTPLDFPVVTTNIKDSFQGDQFFNNPGYGRSGSNSQGNNFQH